MEITDTIVVFRGDAKTIRVEEILDDYGNKYEMQEGDILTLTVRELPVETSPILLQAVSANTIIFLSGEATGAVPAGKYSCDIQLTLANGDPITVFPEQPEEGKVKNWKNFVVDGEVT